MIERAKFAEGISRIGIAVRQTADDATMGVYFDALRDQAETGEWVAFTRWAVAAGRWSWFPKLAEILDALRDFRGQEPVAAEAARAYEAVIAAITYTPEGTVWVYRTVRERCGVAAAEAFLVAGGSAAFETEWRESERRERFLAAYQTAVRAEPETKLLEPGPAPKALPAPAPQPSREEAATVIRRLQDLAGVEPAPPPGPRQVVATDDRLELLRRQAQEAAAAEPEPVS